MGHKVNMKQHLKINHISISREGTWRECRQKYKYRYHLEMAPTEEAIHFFYGKIVHKIIEVYTKGRGLVPIDSVASAVLSGDIALDESKKDKPCVLPWFYRNNLPKHLASFMKLSNQIGLEGEVEWNFSFDLDPPNGKKLVGVIDRLLHLKDMIYIIDYKTTKVGKWRKTPQTIKNDLQLQSYARVAQREFNVPADKIKTALYYLEGGNLISTSFTQSQLDSVEKRLLETFKEIESTDPDSVRGTTGDHCYFCDYQNICPFYQSL